MAECRRRIGSGRELTEWRALYELDPWGEERADWRAAMVASVQANTARDAKVPPYEVTQFLPRFGAEDEERDHEALAERLKAGFGAATGTRAPV